MAYPRSLVHLWPSVEEIFFFYILELFLPFRPFFSFLIYSIMLQRATLSSDTFLTGLPTYGSYLNLDSSENDTVAVIQGPGVRCKGQKSDMTDRRANAGNGPELLGGGSTKSKIRQTRSLVVPEFIDSCVLSLWSNFIFHWDGAVFVQDQTCHQS